MSHLNEKYFLVFLDLIFNEASNYILCTSSDKILQNANLATKNDTFLRYAN